MFILLLDRTFSLLCDRTHKSLTDHYKGGKEFTMNG